MIIGILTKILTGGVLDKVLDAYKAYKSGEISKAEYESRAKIAVEENAAKIEQAWAEAASDTAKAAHASLAASPVLQRAWASVLFIQAAVLLWYQVGTSAYQVWTGQSWPAPMADIEWAYLLIGSMIGVGPLVFRRGKSA